MRRSSRRVRLTLLALAAAVLAVGAVSGAAVSRASAVAVPSAPAGLKVDLMTAPMAVPASGIFLSWVTRDSRAGEAQSGYEVRVSASAGSVVSGAATWDSGRVAGASPWTTYRGPGLAGATRYWWTVRTFDTQGRPGAWAAPAQFGTALGSAWPAAAIWSRPVNGRDSGWAFLRGTLAVPRKPVVAATVYATGVSGVPAHQYVFRLSVDGHVLGDGPVQLPGSGASVRYQAWDVTGEVRAGAAATFGALAYAAADQRFELEVVLEFRGGGRMVWGTGPGWRALDGGSVYPPAGSVGTAYYAAPVEDLNAEKYPFGFDTPSFRAAGWGSPAVKAHITALVPLPAANEVLVRHTPRGVREIGPGHYLIDFGTTQVGGLELSLTSGTNGRKVTIRYGEVLASPDSVRYRLSTGNVYQDVWTLRAGTQTLGYWGYRVFRYAEIIGSPAVITASDVADLALAYPDQPSQSSVTTSDGLLDQVWDFMKNSVEALNLDPYLDSPTRERAVYEGDNYIHQLAQAAVDGDGAQARYSLEVALTQLAGSDPSATITEYDLLAPVAALDSWWQTGDASALPGMYPILRQMVRIAAPIGPDGLVWFPVINELARNRLGDAVPSRSRPASTQSPGIPATMVDWPPSERDGFVFTNENTVVSAFAYAAYHAMALIAAQLGETPDANTYAADAAELKAAIQNKLYDPATGAFTDGAGTTHESMVTSVYVVALGAASPAQARAAARFIAGHGITPTACSVYCAAYYLEAMSDGGLPQAALDAMTAGTETSWRHMIDLGAGSTMEAWDPSIKANLSYSHAWGTGPAFVVPDDLFGIAPLTPGWGSILIAPQPGSLTSGSVTEPTARGEVTESFTHGTGGAVTVSVSIPATATAQVALPGVIPGQQVYVDGNPVTTTALTPASPLAATGGAALAVVTVTSGTHQVSTQP